MLKRFGFSGIEKTACFGALSLLALLPIVNLVLRQFNIIIPDSKSILMNLFLAAGLFSALLASNIGEHISITAVQFIKNDKIKQRITFICTLISVFILAVLFWNSISFIIFGLSGRKIAFISDRIFASAMPIAFALIIAHFVLKYRTARARVWAVAAIYLGCAAALPAIAKIIWGFDPPEPFYSWVNALYDAAWFSKIPVIIFLIIAAFCGMPIFIAIGGIALVMLQAAGLEPDAAPLQVYSALTDSDIIAIPLFTLTGFFLSESKAGERLVRAFKAFFGWMPGGIIIAAIVICAFFTSFTGASGVTILALGGILYKILSDNKYSEKFSIGLLTSAGGIGLLFPPSLPIILVASTTNTILHFMNIPVKYNIIDYFIGGLLPGILLVIGMIIAGFILSSKVKIEKEPFEWKKARGAFSESFFEILLPIIIIAGYFSGFFTLMEASSVSLIYVIIVEVFVKKEIKLNEIHKVFTKAVPIIGGILAILAMAKALSYAFVDSGVPETFTMWMQSAVQSKYFFLLLLNLALIVLGCLMDIFSALLVFLPLIVPLGYAYGIDPVHLGIIFIVNLEAGFLTPPVGMNLFLASYRFEKPFVKICGYVMPFLAARVIIMALVTYVPFFTTFLVNLFK